MKNSFESIKTWIAEKEVQHGQNDRNLEGYPSADLKILKKLEATADFCKRMVIFWINLFSKCNKRYDKKHKMNKSHRASGSRGQDGQKMALRIFFRDS